MVKPVKHRHIDFPLTSTKDNVYLDNKVQHEKCDLLKNTKLSKHFYIISVLIDVSGDKTVTAGTHVAHDVQRSRHFGISRRRQTVQLDRHSHGTKRHSLWGWVDLGPFYSTYFLRNYSQQNGRQNVANDQNLATTKNSQSSNPQRLCYVHNMWVQVAGWGFIPFNFCLAWSWIVFVCKFYLLLGYLDLKLA